MCMMLGKLINTSFEFKVFEINLTVMKLKKKYKIDYGNECKYLPITEFSHIYLHYH